MIIGSHLESVDSPALAADLACRAINMLGKDKFTVHSRLSIDDPTSLENFEHFKSVLMMAYSAGFNACREERQAAREAQRRARQMEVGCHGARWNRVDSCRLANRWHSDEMPTVQMLAAEFERAAAGIRAHLVHLGASPSTDDVCAADRARVTLRGNAMAATQPRRPSPSGANMPEAVSLHLPNNPEIT